MGKSKKSRKKRRRSKGLEKDDSPSAEDCVEGGRSEEAVKKNNADLPAVANPELGAPKKKKSSSKKRRRKSSFHPPLNEGNDSVKPKPAKKRKLSDTAQTDDKGHDEQASVAVAATAPPAFPYPVGEDDHCESPLESYRDILPLLRYIQKTMSTSSSNNKKKGICIYDPYYCNGAVIRHLAELGFSNVYNKKEDCYQVWSSSLSSSSSDHATKQQPYYPSLDIMVTNPPYSGNHMEQLIQHVTSSAQMRHKPWCLLLPNWVHKKEYYIAACARAGIRPFYLVPRKRYVYLPPKDFRASKKSDVHKKSSPFVSMWYVYGGTEQGNEQLIQHWFRCCQQQQQQNDDAVATCDLARSKSALRDLRRKKR